MADKDLNIEIGRRLRNIRERQKKTREQVAESADISAQFLFEIETGKKSMTAKTIINLARALNVSTDYLLLGNIATTSKIANVLEGLSSEKLILAENFLKDFSLGARKK